MLSPIIVYSIFLLYSYKNLSVFIIILSLQSFLLFLFYNKQNKLLNNVIALLFTTSLILVFIEGVLYQREFNRLIKFDGFNKSCLQYDARFGYHWNKEKIRMTSIYGNEIIYDNIFTPNNYGFVSKNNFHKKKGQSVKRYLLFGDSFSAAPFLNETLPDRLQKKLNLKTIKDSIEIYSLAIDGAGLGNWYETFRYFVDNEFDFDGVIIISYKDNLHRDFTVLYSDEDQVFFGRFDEVPDSLTFLDKMTPIWDIKSDREIEKIKEINIYPELRSYMFDYFYDIYNFYSRKEKKIVTFKDVKNDIGEQRIKKLENILDYCNLNNKKFLFATIPEINDLKKGITKNIEHQTLVNHYNIPYFDGHDILSKSYESYYLKYDGHWNQNGSNLFADSLVKYLIKKEYAK